MTTDQCTFVRRDSKQLTVKGEDRLRRKVGMQSTDFTPIHIMHGAIVNALHADCLAGFTLNTVSHINNSQ